MDRHHRRPIRTEELVTISREYREQTRAKVYKCEVFHILIVHSLGSSHLVFLLIPSLQSPIFNLFSL
jgi:hypothetical protein